MKKIFIILFAIFFCTAVFSQNEKQEKAKEYIISIVGNSFYEKYISFNEKISANNMLIVNKEKIMNNMMIFNFKVQETPPVNKLIVIQFTKYSVIDTGNSPVNRKQLKNWIKKPHKCKLPMDENSAIAIAKKEGFQDGIKKWDILFSSSSKNYYQWTIANLIFQSSVKDEGAYSAQGGSIIINAITGQTKQEFWQSIE